MPLIAWEEPRDTIGFAVRRRTQPPPPSRARMRPPSVTPPAGEGFRVGDRATLEEVLTGRRSVRDFDERTPTASLLLDVLASARRSQQQQWPVTPHGDPELGILVASCRVAGLDQGLHEPELESGTWRRHGGPLHLPTLHNAYTAAPALVLIFGSVSDTDDSAYGGLLVRVGSLGYAVWLAARTHGLEASVFGRSSSEVTRAARQDAPGTRHLFTIALGYANQLSPA
ncbi:hypothetical protein [Streptacidiphilus anmyonensis]|uniref:hypothetical protein n=1 Tax=Streptacidiphilus anmyonensis TaxID=405782 RepID=UPI0005A8BC1D|nr:hypothetical protein [Streptacidiphilus anmyonensis]